jgi:hypothetical protein
MMSSFALEFFALSCVEDEHQSPDRFRVLVANERVATFVAFLDPLGDMAWAMVRAEHAYGARPGLYQWPAPLDENRIIALAFAAYAKASHGLVGANFSQAPNGTDIIDLGVITREDE